METTSSSLYNVVQNKEVLSDDGITKPSYIFPLDCPLPEIIELDSDDEDNEEMLAGFELKTIDMFLNNDMLPMPKKSKSDLFPFKHFVYL